MPQQLLVHQLPLFRGIAAEDLDHITLHPHVMELDAWQSVFQESDDAHDVYFLLSGALMALHWTEGGREIIFTQFRIGELFGELSALDGNPRSLAVVARTASRVLVLPKTEFLALVEQNATLRQRLLKSLSLRIRDLTRRNLQLVTQTVEERLRAYLISMAYERGLLHPGAMLDDIPTHSEIAASIGANREIVSRTLSQLRRDGLIRTGRQRIQILDPNGLAPQGSVAPVDPMPATASH